MFPTSPSGFIYRRTSSSAPAAFKHRLSLDINNMDEPKSSNAQVTSDYHDLSHLNHGAIRAYDMCPELASSSSDIITPETNTEHYAGSVLFKSEAPSPNSHLSQAMAASARYVSSLEGTNDEGLLRFAPSGIPIRALQSPWQQQCHVTNSSFTYQEEDKRRSFTAESTANRTISIHSSSSEQSHGLCAAVGAVHNVCLRATKMYLNSHHANRRARASQSSVSNSSDGPDVGPASPHVVDQGPSSQIPGRANSSLHTQNKDQQNLQYPIPRISDSLLKNISGICNMLWAGSQRDRLTVLNVERMAVDNMARLLSWAETVAMGDYDEWMLKDEEALRRVLEAGKNLCAWLGVQEAVMEMRSLEERLMSRGRENAAAWEV